MLFFQCRTGHPLTTHLPTHDKIGQCRQSHLTSEPAAALRLNTPTRAAAPPSHTSDSASHSRRTSIAASIVAASQQHRTRHPRHIAPTSHVTSQTHHARIAATSSFISAAAWYAPSLHLSSIAATSRDTTGEFLTDRDQPGHRSQAPALRRGLCRRPGHRMVQRTDPAAPSDVESSEAGGALRPAR